MGNQSLYNEKVTTLRGTRFPSNSFVFLHMRASNINCLSIFQKMQFHQDTSLIYHKIRTQVLTCGFLNCINMHVLKTLVDFYLTCLAAFQIYLCRVTCEKFYISDRLYWGQFWDWLTWRYGCSEPFRMNEFAEWCTWTLPFVASFLSHGLSMILMKVWFYIFIG